MTEISYTDSVDAQEYETKASALLSRLMPYRNDVSEISILCRRSDYSAGRIAQAIEDCNAHVLNLNLTSDNPGEDMVVVDVRVDRSDVASIARSLARYSYNVLDYAGSEDAVSESDKMKVAELLRYLDM